MDLKSIYKGKKVFVTGHTGFKGSWLITWLRLLDAQIMGFALSPENSFDLYDSINGDSFCKSVISDIRDFEKLKSEILSFKPDFIFHLAAQPLVRTSYDNPMYTFEVNVQGTVNVLDALRGYDRPCIAVMITTDKVYDNLEDGHYYCETDRLGGYDPYSSSKACAELVIDSYRKSFFNPNQYPLHKKSISVARAGNVIGGGDWSKDRIMPDIVRALQSGNSIELRNPQSVRPWQHVLDPLHGYLVLAANQVLDPVKFADVYNFGPEPFDNLTVEELTKEAIRIWGKGMYRKEIANKKNHEAGLLHLDIQKAKKNLQWKPLHNSSEALAKTISWYKEAPASNPSRTTMQQIIEYNKKYYGV
jgi:CDP-glucose 4,6-dehydratase